MARDIKTSVYFVQVATPLVHDFYIVRLVVQKQDYTLVTLLQPDAWEQINGDTVSGELEALTRHFPAPVAITHRGHRLVWITMNGSAACCACKEEWHEQRSTVVRPQRGGV